jgi:NnrS protein
MNLLQINVRRPIPLALAIVREIIAGRNWRNLAVLVIFALLITAQTLFHVELMVIGVLGDVSEYRSAGIHACTVSWALRSIRPDACRPATVGVRICAYCITRWRVRCEISSL